MAIPTPWVTVDPNFARNSGGQLCSDGDDVYSVDDVAGNGATITPDTTNRPKIKIIGGRKRFWFPSGIIAFFTVTLPAARNYDAISHLIAFEMPATSNPSASVTSYTLLASTTTTAGAQWRAGVSTLLTNATPYSGGFTVVDGSATARLANKYGAGCASFNGGSLHFCNIVTFRTSGGSLRYLINGTDLEGSVTQSAASGTLTAFYLGKHNSNPSTFNFSGGYVDLWHIYDSVISGTDAVDAYTAKRSTLPFFVNPDWTQPLLMMIGPSHFAGIQTTTDKCWWRKGFVTDVATNFPNGAPQWLIMGYPGAGFTGIRAAFDALIPAEIPANAAKPILFGAGASNEIRGGGQTPAATYALCKAWQQSFLAANANGIFITDSTGPRPDENPDLEGYDALLLAQHTSGGPGPHTYIGTGGDFSTRAYFVHVRENTNIGGAGNNTTGIAANWTNTAPDGLTPTNVHNFYHTDAVHPDGTDTTNPGQTQYLNEVLPMLQFALTTAASSGGSFGVPGGLMGMRPLRRRDCDTKGRSLA